MENSVYLRGPTTGFESNLVNCEAANIASTSYNQGQINKLVKIKALSSG